jgi:cytidine deaminase
MKNYDKNKLIEAAKQAAMRAYAPYSHFHVGAALLTHNGSIYKGCNVENASYSATVCAERSAISLALCAGERDFVAIAVVGGKNGEITDFCTPCGVCRQVLNEFCAPDFEIVLSDGKNSRTCTLSDLLPFAFGLRDELGETF